MKSSNNDVGGMSGLSLKTHLVNPLMNLLLVSKPCDTSIMNHIPNMGVQTLTLGMHIQNPPKPIIVAPLGSC